MQEEPTNEEMLEAIKEESVTEQQEAAPEAPQDGEQAEETPAGYQFKSDDDLLAHKWKYKANGKEIEEDFGTILKRASQGYHYAQQMADLKRQQEEYDPKISRAQELEEKYGKFEAYAKENPEWYNHWQNAWQNRGTEGLQSEGQSNPAQDIDARVNAILEDKLKTVNEFAQSVEEQKKQAEVEAQDRALQEEIESIRSKYEDIDFDKTDPDSGKSLEYEVLEFQIQNGLNSFDKAFKAFYHDQLVNREVMRQKEAWLKEQQKAAKEGIVQGQSTREKTYDHKNSSYDQINDHIMKEYGFQS